MSEERVSASLISLRVKAESYRALAFVLFVSDSRCKSEKAIFPQRRRGNPSELKRFIIIYSVFI